jgi:hypothetical protein
VRASARAAAATAFEQQQAIGGETIASRASVIVHPAVWHPAQRKFVLPA